MRKVFLVDDEIVIREGIRNSFPWEESGYTLVGEAPDGEIALPMIRDAQPDILITDIRMPFMDGLALCREVMRQLPWMGVLILSGYDDFEYARQAIALGVKEYLLKPLSLQELKEALDKVSARLEDERSARERAETMRRRVMTGSRFVKQKLLSALFFDAPSENGAQKTLEAMRGLGVNLAANCYVVMDLTFQPPSAPPADAVERLAALAENSGGTVHVCEAKHGALALVLGDTDADTEERVYAFANTATRALEHSGFTGVLASIGETVHDFSELPRAMQSARHIRHIAAAKQTQVTRIIGERELTDTQSRLPNLELRPLREHLQYIEPQELPSAFEEYLASLGASDIHSAVADDYLQVEALLTASSIVKESGGDAEAVLGEAWARVAANEGTADHQAVLSLLRKAVDYRAASGSMTGRSSIAKALGFLSRRFSDSTLMLQTVANEANMSSSRFSTVFAQEMGYTFTEYLTALRIGKAKELLRATDLRSSEIAFEVGYNDSHYFSYLFKKNTGLTPGEYRRGRNENEQK